MHTSSRRKNYTCVSDNRALACSIRATTELVAYDLRHELYERASKERTGFQSNIFTFGFFSRETNPEPTTQKT